ncbi:MAG: hypothetical protein IJC15_06740 [Clostridia bacterium]|nr:hypothetical protein [Clostridia bacterium]
MKRIFCALCAMLTLCALCACRQEPFAIHTLDDGLTCAVYGSTMGIRRIEATAADGSVQIFKLKNPDIEPDAAGGVELIDLDFDGHLDLTVRTRLYANGDIGRACYLWREGRLVEDDLLSAQRSLTADPETQTLTAWDRYVIEEERESRTRLTYVWHEGSPTLVHSVELIHHIGEGEDIYCRIESAAEPGEPLAVIEEKWIFPEQFDENTIWN